MDRLKSMRIFQAVADHGGFAAASRSLHISASAATRAIAELEHQLGAQLLQRTTRALALTEIGQSYLMACRRILAEVDEAERAASGEAIAPRGLLSVTAPFLFGRLHVAPVVLEFLNHYPEIRVSLISLDRVVNLIEEGIDVAVRIGPLRDSSLIATKVGEVQRIVCASPAYLRARGTPKEPRDLIEHDVIELAGMVSLGGWSFGSNIRESANRIIPRLTVNQPDVAIAAALAGKGLTRVLSYQAADHIREGRLKVVLENAQPDPVPIHLVHPEARPPSAKVRAFISFAARRLRSREFGA